MFQFNLQNTLKLLSVSPLPFSTRNLADGPWGVHDNLDEWIDYVSQAKLKCGESPEKNELQYISDIRITNKNLVNVSMNGNNTKRMEKRTT